MHGQGSALGRYDFFDAASGVAAKLDWDALQPPWVIHHTASSTVLQLYACWTSIVAPVPTPTLSSMVRMIARSRATTGVVMVGHREAKCFVVWGNTFNVLLLLGVVASLIGATLAFVALDLNDARFHPSADENRGACSCDCLQALNPL